MANSLPMMLRVYQRLSAAAVPLAPALIQRRLKQGKEDPARIGERRGMSGDIRPRGPLVWIHGASVGRTGVGRARAGRRGRTRGERPARHERGRGQQRRAEPAEAAEGAEEAEEVPRGAAFEASVSAHETE